MGLKHFNIFNQPINNYLCWFMLPSNVISHLIADLGSPTPTVLITAGMRHEDVLIITISSVVYIRRSLTFE